MNTRVVSTTVKALAVARLFRNHLRLVVVGLVMALMAVASYLPSRVQSVAAPVALDPPGLSVTAVTNTSISLSWDQVPNASEYQLERSESMSGPFNRRDSQTGTTFTDTQVGTQKSYIYRVRAIRSSQQGFDVSTPSNMAFGTTFTFEFAQLPGKTISARHFHDLRKTINAVRSLAALPEIPEQNMTGQPVRAADVLNLRLKLDEALNAMFISRVYTDPSLITGANGTQVKAVHVEELQALSTRGFSNSAGPLYLNSSKSVGGEYSNVIILPKAPVHLSVLPDRRVLFWSRDMILNASSEVKQRTNSSDAYIWNMSTVPHQLQHVPNSRTNLFCSGHTFLPNGDLFVTGGHASTHFDGAGEAQTNIFNFNATSWSAGPDMNNGRWYPYNVTLGTGEPLIMAGSYWVNEGSMGWDPDDPNDLPTGTPPAPTPSPVLADNLVSEVYTPGVGLRPMPTPPGGQLLPYPYLHLLSNGQVFQAESGLIGSTAQKLSRLFDPKTKTWPSSPALGNTQYPHANGSSVLLEDDTVMLIGGFANSNLPTREVESIKPTSSPSPPVWEDRAPMRFARAYHTATLLPDGKVLVTGGVSCQGRINIAIYSNGIPICSEGGVLSPELYDPATGQWTTMNPQALPRAYHSTAALLPDGRVLIAGGGYPGAIGQQTGLGHLIVDLDSYQARLWGQDNAEIFSPPYLFDADGTPADRPQINSAPESVTYGEQFDLDTFGAGLQPKVNFVRLPSVTHGNNQDQRLVSVSTMLVPGGIRVTMPTSPDELPPGYYMVFVLNSSGVPSIAAMIRVQNSSLFTSQTPASSATVSSREQGMEFSSSVNGEITHVRFYKASGETAGSHMARIWDTTTGLQVASAAFVGETSSGWQTATLQTPLPITANTKYRITTNVHNKTATTSNFFTVPLMRGPLFAWGSYFSTSANVYPTSSSSSNFFVDVTFK